MSRPNPTPARAAAAAFDFDVVTDVVPRPARKPDPAPECPAAGAETTGAAHREPAKAEG